MSSDKIEQSIRKIVISLLLVLGVYIYTNYLEGPIQNIFRENISDTQPVNVTRKVDGSLMVHFVDVGQADCILVSTQDHNMLIDAGNNEDGDKLVDYFNSLGIKKFDYVFGTHAHEDHIGGMDNIIDNFEIDDFYMPDVVSSSRTFEDVLLALEEKKLAFQTPNVGEQFYLADAIVKVLYVGDEDSDLNDTSIVLKLSYGNNSFLLTGDATANVEKKLLNSDIKADVLKIGHHGSQYSSSIDFLEKVNPKYAIIQVGEGNVYDHPKIETLNKLNNLKIRVYRTDLNGTIIAKSDGKEITFSTKETDTDG